MNFSKYNLFLIITVFLLSASLFAQAQNKKEITIGEYPGGLRLDGLLNEDFWAYADSIDKLTMVEPSENHPASYKTVVKILADSRNIIIGIYCYDDPLKITAYTKARDVKLYGEDNIKFVLDTYMDERSGYIFAINPFGARYDAVIADRGERENSNWDGVWDAETVTTSKGWSAEIIIPVKTLGFQNGLHVWGFNVERRIQRLLEIDRWSALKRNYKVTSLSETGLIVELPEFDLGLGLVMRLSPETGFHKNFNDRFFIDKSLSGDLTQRITPDISATLTVNTDFAETEVDTRRTNLTRFPLFFPEKRTFFLEGADIFDFGLGLGKDVIPFFSRKIGLFDAKQIPVIFGAKLNGKLGDTNFGGLVVRTDKVDSLVPRSNMSVVRVKRNLFEQSNVGIIATSGDPSGLKNSWLIGADFTYQISDLFGDKNFLAGIWGLHCNRPDLTGNKNSYGVKLDYPNDLFDISLTYKFIGEAFEPSLGFVPRNGIKSYKFGFDYMPRPEESFIRQFFFESALWLVTDLNDQWESYGFFTAPIHFLLESGDRFEFNIMPAGEKLKVPFNINEGVALPVGEYNYMRYRIEFETASKRAVGGQATWWFGTFYDGTLDEIELTASLRFTSNIIIDLNYEKNIVDLKEGAFHQELFGGRLQLNFSPDLQLSSFIQYDNETNSFGTNSRMRWTITPLTDLYLVYNHNIDKIENNKWRFNSNQFIVKLSYGLWY